MSSYGTVTMFMPGSSHFCSYLSIEHAIQHSSHSLTTTMMSGLQQQRSGVQQHAAARRPATARYAGRHKVPQRAQAFKRGIKDEPLVIPEALVSQIRNANEEWIDDAVSRPLVHPNGSSVVLASTTAWAPLQW